MDRALARDRAFVPLVSVPLILEYESVLRREEHMTCANMTPASVDKLLNAFISVSVQVHLGFFRRPTVPDPGDEHIVNLALRGRADAIVTQNTRHFASLGPAYGVRCYTPGEAIRLIRS